jgi:hypothetical protein
VIVLVVVFAVMVGVTGTARAANVKPAAKVVPAADYVRGVCGALGAWMEVAFPLGTDLTSRSGGLADGDAAALARNRAVRDLQRRAKATESLITKTAAVGTPDVAGGASLATAHLQGLVANRDVYQRAASRAAGLDPVRSTKLAGQLDDLQNWFLGRFNQLGSPIASLSADPLLGPLVATDTDCAVVTEGYAPSWQPTGFVVGDCVNYQGFTTVDCGKPHDIEVYLATSYPAGPDDPYPGDTAVQTTVDDLCRAAFAGYVGVPTVRSKLAYNEFPPDEETWRLGNREIMCAVGLPKDRQVTGSLRGSGR